MGFNQGNEGQHAMTLAILEYIDNNARMILERFAEGETSDPFSGMTRDDAMHAFNETFIDAIESATMGCPSELLPPSTGDALHDDLTATNFDALICNLLTARIFQLLFAYELTEDDLDPNQG